MALFGKEKTKVKSKPQAADSGSMQDLYKDEGSVKSKDGVKSGAKDLAMAAQVLVRPLVTEKATNLSGIGKYVFVVSAKANKISVARAIQATYKVKPVAVNIMNIEGKRVSRGRIGGKRSDWRKAVITLKKGDTIKIYEGV